MSGKEETEKEDDTTNANECFCVECKLLITVGSNYCKCDKCKGHYHSECMKLTKVRFKNNKTINACTVCIAATNSMAAVATGVATRSRMQSTSSSSSYTFSDLRQTPTPTQSEAAPIMLSAEQFSMIMSKLGKLDQLDTVQSSINSIEENMKTVTGDILKLRKDMEQTTGNLSKQLQDTGKTLHDLEVNQSAMKDELTTLQERVNSIATGNTPLLLTSTDNDQAQTQAEEVKSLARQVQKLTSHQQSLAHSSDIVIGGLSPDCFDDLKLAAYAVITTLYSDATTDDVLAVKPLRSRNSNDSQVSSLPGSVTPVVNTTTAAPVVDKTTVSTASTSAAGSKDYTTVTSDQSHTPRVDKIVPLLVTLSSSILARAVISAKINRKKLTSKQLDAASIAAAGARREIPLSNINVNEFLPRETYQLKLRVHAKSKDKRYDFIYFIRNGCIYARKKKEDVPVLIASDYDLQDFLKKLPPPVQQQQHPQQHPPEQQQHKPKQKLKDKPSKPQ